MGCSLQIDLIRRSTSARQRGSVQDAVTGLHASHAMISDMDNCDAWDSLYMFVEAATPHMLAVCSILPVALEQP